MKNDRLDFVLRFVLLSLLFTFTMGSPALVHAQGGGSETRASSDQDKHSGLAPVFHDDDDDCDRDDRDARNTGDSDWDDCHPQVWVAAVWTADEGLNPRTSFDAGDPIQWVITLKNTKSRAVSVELTYVVRDPSGTVLSRSERTVSASPGVSYWEEAGVVPDAAGTYSFTGTAEYRDSTSRKTARYEVGNACHTLTTSSSPGAGGSVAASPAPDCNNGTQYSTGTVVTLTAGANTGFAFSSWTGAVTGSLNPATVTMTADQSVTANFVEFTGLTAGTYDDTDPAWTYTGSWTTDTNAGYFDGTSHVSTTAGNEATVTIYGSQFTLYFTGDTDHGSMDVYVDGVQIDTIDQSSATTMFQRTWTSPVLSSSVHELRFVHADGTAVDIDAIEIQTISDNSAPAAIADLTAATGAAAGTVELSWTAPGDDNNTGTAASYEVRYSTIAISDEATWNAATPVTTAVPVPSAAGSEESVTVSGLTPDATYFFAVRAEDEGGNLGDLSNSPSAAAGAGAVAEVLYDDADATWTYSGTWYTFSGAGPYNDTLHQSITPGNYAELTFTGVQVELTYLKAYGRGSFNIYLDGNLVDTLNGVNSAVVWQPTWISPVLSSGTHTIRIQVVSGGWVDVDVVQVYDAPISPTPVGAGVYDDDDIAWTYSGTWAYFSGPGPYSDTLHQNNTPGSYAEVYFTGTQVTLTYLQAPVRGSINVYIDGTQVDTINALNGNIVWQSTWTSQTLSAGAHTVRFENADGGWMDLDAIQVEGASGPPTPVGAGTYDDMNSAWSYSETWQVFNGTGPYNDTLHQNSVPGSYAEFVFNGTQVILTYLQAPGRGSIDVYLDGTLVETLDALNMDVVWQPTWTSQILAAGTHTVRFENGGGGWIDIDALTVQE